MKRLSALLGLMLLLCGALPGNTHAVPNPPIEKGLLITPLRQFPSVDAGKSAQSNFSIANLTADPLVVNLSVQQFSVSDYVYTYQFSKTTNDWLHLGTTSVTLQPNQTRDISYSVNVPAGTAPGGHYYTLFASANVTSGGVASTIQATDLVYLTVSGKLTTVSHLLGSSIHWISFGRTIPYTLLPVNTGNVYSFIYVSGELHGLFVRAPETSAAHLLMPGKVRQLSDSIPSPRLPGVYRAVYGYKTDAGWVIQQSHLVLFVPPWFIAFLLAALLVAGKYLPRRHQSDSTSPDRSTED